MRPVIPIAVLLAAAPAMAQGGFSSSERALGAQENPKLVAQLGGVYRGPQARYVEAVGRRIAAQSGGRARPEDYTVTLLNSPVSNALAIPGGYVYVTRQLLALMNNEAELAFVMGHEVGHVAARHAQKRQRSSLWGAVGQLAVGVLTGSSLFADLAGRGAQVLVLGYSREQERQADSLGLRYLVKAGYPAAAGPEILDSLGQQDRFNARLTGLDESSASPQWLRTHPANEPRVARARAEAVKLGGQAGEAALGRDRFLDAIDGLLYDDDPEQGYIDGSSFRHPKLGVAFDLPRGYVLANSAEAVSATGPGNTRVLFSGGRIGPNQSLDDYSRLVLQQLGASGGEGRIEGATINGLPAAITRLRINGKSGPVDVTLAAYRWSANTAYQLLFVAPAGSGGDLGPALRSMRRLAGAEAARLQPRRVRVVRVAPGDTIATLARRMAYRDNQAARFMVLNGIDAARPLRPGERLKLIVYSAT